MVNYHYEPLSAQDASFLVFETPNAHMHVGGIVLYDAGPLSTSSGGVDIGRIRDYIRSRLDWIPRYRQRLAYVPLEDRAVWVDDENFNLSYHVRHTSLPRPGDDGQLKRLTARILSQQLDRGKPLWESWVIEGLQGGRIAMLTKVHHCMIDGVSGVDLSTVLMRAQPDDTIEEPAEWIPRPAPHGAQLLRSEISRRLRAPLRLAAAVGDFVREPGRVLSEAAQAGLAIGQLLATGLRRAGETPLNKPIGPHRRCDWFTLDLNEVKRVKNRLGGTVNDVVLATVSGGLRRFFERRRIDIRQLEYRVAVPVNMRSAAERGRMGNRVSAWLLPLPLHERDPRLRLALVRERTAGLKESRQERAAEVLNQMLEWTSSPLLLAAGVRLTSRINPYNLVVTNVPGPGFPLYLLGTPMLEAFPQVPLFENQGLGIAIVSYLGQLCWGFNADWDLLPDLRDLVEGTKLEFHALRAAADHPATEIRSKLPAVKGNIGRQRHRGPRDPGRRAAPISRLGM